MKRLIALALCAMMVLTACSSSPSGSENSGSSQDAAQGPSGEFRSVYATELTTLNYLMTSNDANIQLSYLIEDGLVEFDQYGVMIPSLAESWSVAEDNVTYTFKLRPGLKWYTWDGQEYGDLTAQDFVTAMKWVLTKENTATTSNTIYNVIKGAKDYYDGVTTDFSTVGIRAVDDTTVEYTLIKPTPYFVNQVSFPCFYPLNEQFLNEVGEEFGTDKDKLLYCGAYLIDKYEPENERILVANPNYWHKEIISIETLSYKFNKEANAIGAELFLRGEVSDFILPGTILDEWMNDPEKQDMFFPHNLTNMSYFMNLNFDPHYDEAYAPQDWKTAVNNLNFRKSLFHGFDRVAAVLTMEPLEPERKLLNTMTRRGLVQVGGVDYTMMSGLDEYTNNESFNKDKALEYKAKAMEELEGQVTFPIQIVMPYSTAKVDTANRVQVIEQQMENLLGKDYIDIILQPTPSSSVSKDIRQPGAYSMMEIGWGPDYKDPMGMMDPVLEESRANTYGRVHMCEDLLDENGNSIFEAMVYEANEEVTDMQKRYEMFAEAEKLLLDNACVIPFYTSGGGYRASYIDPFSGYTGQMGRYGLSKVKGAKLLDHPMGMEEYKAAEVEFNKAMQEAFKNAK